MCSLMPNFSLIGRPACDCLCGRKKTKIWPNCKYWGFYTHTPFCRSGPNFVYDSEPLMYCFMPYFSLININMLLPVQANCISLCQNNETVKFDLIWPWNLTILVKCSERRVFFWYLEPRWYFLAPWLPVFNKKSHQKFLSGFWPAYYWFSHNSGEGQFQLSRRRETARSFVELEIC